MTRMWRGEELRLPLEPLPPLFTFEELFRQNLDRDVPRQPQVPRPIDLPHPARADLAEDLVGTELRAGGERHVSVPAPPTSSGRPSSASSRPARAGLR